MSARVEDRTGTPKADESSAGERPLTRLQIRAQKPGLDLTCTKVAVDFQGITRDTAEQRIAAGLQSLTEACGADSVAVLRLDDSRTSFAEVYAGRSTFSACNPAVLKD